MAKAVAKKVMKKGKYFGDFSQHFDQPT